MATSTDIALQSSNYTGNAGLGGGFFGEIEIDTRPLQQLANYTYSYNEAEKKQRQKDAEEQAKQLADLTAYDPNSPIQKDRDLLYSKLNELQTWVRDNPDVLDYKNNQAGWLEYNKRKNDFDNMLKSGKVRALMYKAKEQKIAAATSPERKAFLLKKLEQEVADTDIYTPLKMDDEWDVQPVAVAPAPQKKFDVTVELDNTRAKRKFNLVDGAALNSRAQAYVSGLYGSYVDKDSPEYVNADERTRKMYDDRHSEGESLGTYEPIKSAEHITTILSKYVKDGALDMESLQKENSDNPIVMGVLSTISQYNKRMAAYREAIKNGSYTDKLGARVVFGNMTGMNPNDYQDINIADGVTPVELVKARMLGIAPPDGYETDVENTDNAIQEAQVGVAQKNAETNRMRARAYVSDLERKWQEKKDDKDFDNTLNTEWRANLLNQDKLLFPDQDGKVGVVNPKIKAETSIPMYTIGSDGKVTLLKPRKATPIYEKGSKTKIIGYKGGYYAVDYIDPSTKRKFTGGDIANAYAKFKKDMAAAGLDWSGSMDDYVKKQIEIGNFDAKVIGENGSTTQNLHNSAARIIANKNTKAGQQGIWNDGTFEDDGGSSSSEGSSSSVTNNQDF